jgi:hypothetical protein
LPVAVALHNLEEALWLPRWSQTTSGRWRRPVEPWPFRFAAFVLTLVAFLIAAWTQVRGPGSLPHYLLASYALGQGLNVIVPHAMVTLTTRRYAPGLLTGLLFVVPAASALLLRSLPSGALVAGRVAVVAAVFIPLMVGSIPLLFRVGAGCDGAGTAEGDSGVGRWLLRTEPETWLRIGPGCASGE